MFVTVVTVISLYLLAIFCICEFFSGRGVGINGPFNFRGLDQQEVINRDK
jgi:hypothetical protein